MEEFDISQFNYCSLVQMFHSRKLNNRINLIHERAVKLNYKKNHSSFNEHLKKDNSRSIYSGNLHLLAAEIYKVESGIVPQIMKEMFELNGLL